MFVINRASASLPHTKILTVKLQFQPCVTALSFERPERRIEQDVFTFSAFFCLSKHC